MACGAGRPRLRGQQVSEVAAFFAWAGAALIVLSDGRRGLALGLALIAPGFAVLALVAGESLAAVAILLGGAFAAVQRLRTGPDVWGLMPSGSTSRLLLSIAGGLLAGERVTQDGTFHRADDVVLLPGP